MVSQVLGKKRSENNNDAWGKSWATKYFVFQHFSNELLTGTTKVFKVLRFYDFALEMGIIKLR